MFSKFWIVNIVLAAGVIFFAVKTHDVWFGRQAAKPAPSADVKKEAVQEKQFKKPNLPSESSYRSIADKNLFAEDRTEYLPPEPEPEPEKGAEPEKEPEPEIKPFEGFGKKVTLYGVVIFNDLKKALISNPNRRRGEPTDIWVEKGDTIMEMKKRDKTEIFKVDDILEDRILVKEDSNRYEVLLFDKENPKKRPSVKKEDAPTVVAPKKKPKKPAARKVRKPQARKAPKRAGRTVENKEASGTDYEVINTPFGEIKRRKK